MAQLTIASKSYPIAYPVAALTRILRSLKINTQEFSELAVKRDPETLAMFSATVAWSGLVSGAVREGKPKPFADPEELLENIETLDDLLPAFDMWQTAWAKFTGADEAKEQPADTAETEAPNAGEILPPTV
jgi:hypothetical protein